MVPKMDWDLFEEWFFDLGGVYLGAFRIKFDTLQPSRGAMEGFSSPKSIQVVENGGSRGQKDQKKPPFGGLLWAQFRPRRRQKDLLMRPCPDLVENYVILGVF